MYGTVMLMHKNDKVCELNINRSNQVERVSGLTEDARGLLPPSVSDADGRDLRIEFTRWIRSRIFSPARTDIMEMQPFLPWETLSQAGKISMFDTYWFKKDKCEEWDTMNPYDNWNPKTDPICMLNLKPEYVKKDKVILSPNLAIPGAENVFFYGNGKSFFLLTPDVIKEMNYYKKNKENPVVAKRFYTTVSDRLFVAKEIETSKDIESFPVSELFVATEGFTPKSMHGLYHCLNHYGIPNEQITHFMQHMYEADDHVGNEDRDLDTLYVLRDSNTLETIGLAKL